MQFVAKLDQTLKRFDFSHYGWTELSKPFSLALYEDWLKAGHHGSMEYLVTHLPAKADSQSWQPRARSAIVIAKNYHPHPYASETKLSARTALYAAGEDYHFAFREELNRVAESLKQDFPGEEFLCFTDSAPILERDLAARAGLGWVGKNSCVIDRERGSLFFIGEILTTLDLKNPNPLLHDFCGSCTRCIDACPTQAIESPRVLNAKKCISYWTIEAKTVAPRELREKFGDWFFGCDICQTVCPWNEKAFGKAVMQSLSRETVEPPLIEELREILNSSNKALEKRFAKLPYSRARARGLKRNAIYVAGNLRLVELKDAVEGYRQDAELGDLAEWSISKLER